MAFFKGQRTLTINLVIVRYTIRVVVHSHRISLVVMYKQAVHSSYTAVAEGQGGLVTINNQRVKVVGVPIMVDHGGIRGTPSVFNVEDMVTTLKSTEMGPVLRRWRSRVMTVYHVINCK